ADGGPAGGRREEGGGPRARDQGPGRSGRVPRAMGAQGLGALGGGLRRRRRIPALTDAALAGAGQLELVRRRFLAYGLLGWALEVAFTGATDCLKLRDRRLRGHSYLWMLPIYGGGGLLLEVLHDRLASRNVPRWARSLAYTLGILLRGVRQRRAARSRDRRRPL